MKDNELNIFETSVLEEIVGANLSKCPKLKEHIGCLDVKHRDKTGVGLFIDFDYKCTARKRLELFDSMCCLSSEKLLYIEGLDFPVNYELNLTDGKIDFLELVTNGEQWNGKIKNFRFDE